MNCDEKVDFFDYAMPHSKAKIELLNSYLVPWIRKVTYGTKKNCLICDTFAGEGIYSDGTIGSPFVIIENAINYLEQGVGTTYEVLLAFVEADKERFNKLKINIENFFNCSLKSDEFNKIPNRKLSIMISNLEHKIFLNELTNQVDSLIPSLFFVDPFGFKDVDLIDITTTINKYYSCEFIVNFMYEEFNRFKSVDCFKQSANNFIGSNIDEIICETKDMLPKDRRNAIISKYKENIKKNGVKYVLDFDIQKDNSYATKMILVFMSNSYYGFNVMKSTMLKLAENIDYEYVTKEKNTINLFSLFAKDLLLNEMAYVVKNNFTGKTVPLESVILFCREHDFIPEDKCRALLKELASKDELFIIKDGKEKRKPKQFPNGCLVVFE